MKKTRMPQRLLALVLVLMMLISVLPVSAMAAELTPADAQTGLTATDVTNELTDSDRLSIFEENMDPSKVSKSDVPADDEMVRVIVQLDADSLLDARNRTNAGMSMLDFQQTAAAKAQLEEIADVQLSVMNAMESQSIPSSFTFSYTSVISGFAAQVPYGRINDIKNMDGVVDVVLCQTYYTDSMGSATLGQALTAAEVAAYSNNTQYQGEGTHIGILDTGLDVKTTRPLPTLLPCRSCKSPACPSCSIRSARARTARPRSPHTAMPLCGMPRSTAPAPWSC